MLSNDGRIVCLDMKMMAPFNNNNVNSYKGNGYKRYKKNETLLFMRSYFVENI